MGILGQLSEMAKAGQTEQLRSYMTTELGVSADSLHDLRAYDPRIAGAHKRMMNHNMEISIASI